MRLHLRPVATRQVLAASFGREAFHAGPSTATTAGGAVAVAYAIRWLELGDGRARPDWATITKGVVGDLVQHPALLVRPS